MCTCMHMCEMEMHSRVTVTLLFIMISIHQLHGASKSIQSICCAHIRMMLYNVPQGKVPKVYTVFHMYTLH